MKNFIKENKIKVIAISSVVIVSVAIVVALKLNNKNIVATSTPKNTTNKVKTINRKSSKNTATIVDDVQDEQDEQDEQVEQVEINDKNADTKEVKTTNKTPNKVENTNAKSNVAHQHNFQPIYATEKVLVQNAYDEPQYANVQHTVCSTCGSIIDGIGSSKHYELTGCIGGSHTTMVQEQVGTIHHDAVYQDRQVIKGYKCSCGATK